MKTLILLAMLLPLPALADSFAIVFGAFSNHLGPAKSPVALSDDIPAEMLPEYRPEWNESNETLGIEYTFDSGFSVIAANYTDSYGRDSRYAGAGWMWPLYQRGDFSVDGGGYVLYFDHDGYTIDLDPPAGFEYLQFVMPSRNYVAPLPGISVRYKMLGANITVIPPIEDGVPWTSAIQLKLVF